MDNSHGVGHTKRRNNKDKKQPTATVPSVLTESEDVTEKSHDQGLIEAQIYDVLSSAEFLALEASAEFAVPLSTTQSKQQLIDNALMDINLGNDPEQLLNQLDESDLMDYVADDDLWKEQLTLEDEPF